MIKVMRTGSDQYGRYIKALVCGEPGSGKTLISSTFEDPFYASAEGGLMSIASRKIPFTEISSMKDLVSLRNVLSQPENVRNEILGVPVKTVVIDTIDEVQGIAIQELLESEKKAQMAIQDWGKIADEMKALIRGFRNLDMNVIFTCHLKLVTDEETGRSWYAPGLQGQIADKIPGYVDLSLLIQSTTVTEIVDGASHKVDKRLLLSYPTKQYPFLKDRSGQLPRDFEINFNDDFQRIHEAIYGGIDDVPDTETVTELDTSPVEAEAPKEEKKARPVSPQIPTVEESKAAKAAEKAPVTSSAVLAAQKLRGKGA